jgi:hypothetical protein
MTGSPDAIASAAARPIASKCDGCARSRTREATRATASGGWAPTNLIAIGQSVTRHEFLRLTADIPGDIRHRRADDTIWAPGRA